MGSLPEKPRQHLTREEIRERILNAPIDPVANQMDDTAQTPVRPPFILDPLVREWAQEIEHEADRFARATELQEQLADSALSFIQRMATQPIEFDSEILQARWIDREAVAEELQAEERQAQLVVEKLAALIGERSHADETPGNLSAEQAEIKHKHRNPGGRPRKGFNYAAYEAAYRLQRHKNTELSDRES